MTIAGGRGAAPREEHAGLQKGELGRGAAAQSAAAHLVRTSVIVDGGLAAGGGGAGSMAAAGAGTWQARWEEYPSARIF